MSDGLEKNFTRLNDSVKDYLKTKVDLMKVSLLSKLTKLTAAMVYIWVIATFAILILIFAAAGFVVWFGETYHNFSEGFLLAGSFMLLIMVLFIIFRRRIVATPILRHYSEIIFEDENESDFETNMNFHHPKSSGEND